MSAAFAAVGFKPGDPAEVGLDSEILKDHRQRLRRHQEEFGTFHGQGECIVGNGKVVYLDLCGFSDKEHGIKMTERTLFRGNSLMKPITATAFMTLVEQGRVGLDDPLSRYIPKFASVRVRRKNGNGDEPLRRPITLRHLIMHTAGFGYGPGNSDHGLRVVSTTTAEKMYKQISAAMQSGEIDSLEKLCDALSEKPLLFQPGSDYEYGLGMDVLGRVIEVVTGQPLKQVIQDRVLTPVGMLDTGWDVPRSSAKQICGYYRLMRTPGTPGRWLQRLDGDTPQDSSYVRGSATHFKGSVPTGGGLWGHNRTGLLFSMRDVALFCQMILNGGVSVSGRRVLKRSTVHSLSQNWFENKRSCVKRCPPGWGSHAVGWSPLGHIKLTGCHAGAIFMGGVSCFWMDPRRKVIGVIMTETYWQENPLGYDADRDSLDKVLEHAFASGSKAKGGKKRKAGALTNGGSEKTSVKKHRDK